MGLRLLWAACDGEATRAFFHCVGAADAGRDTLRLGAAELSFIQADAACPPSRLDQMLGPRLLVVLGDDAWFDASRMALRAAGVDVSRSRETPQARGMYVRSPDGDTLELAAIAGTAPSAPLKVELGVASRDPSAAAQRLVSALGAKPVDEDQKPGSGGGKRIVSLSGARLHIFAAAPDAAAPEPTLSAHSGVRMIGLAVGDVAQALEACLAQGFSRIPEPAAGCAQVVVDPEGVAFGLSPT